MWGLEAGDEVGDLRVGGGPAGAEADDGVVSVEGGNHIEAGMLGKRGHQPYITPKLPIVYPNPSTSTRTSDSMSKDSTCSLPCCPLTCVSVSGTHVLVNQASLVCAPWLGNINQAS